MKPKTTVSPPARNSFAPPPREKKDPTKLSVKKLSSFSGSQKSSSSWAAARTASDSGSKSRTPSSSKGSSRSGALRTTFADKLERVHEDMDRELDIAPIATSVPGPNPALFETLENEDVNIGNAIANSYHIEIPDDLLVRIYKFVTPYGRTLTEREVSDHSRDGRAFYGFMDESFGRNQYGIENNQVATVQKAPEVISSEELGLKLQIDNDISGLVAEKSLEQQRDVLNLLLSKNILKEGFEPAGWFWVIKTYGRMAVLPVKKANKSGVAFVPKYKFGVRPTTGGNKLFILPVEHFVSSKTIGELGPIRINCDVLYEPTGRTLRNASVRKDFDGSYEFQEGTSVDQFAKERYGLSDLPESKFLIQCRDNFYAPGLCRLTYDHRKIFATRLGEQPELFQKCVQMGRDHLSLKMPFINISESMTRVNTIKMENPTVIINENEIELSKLPEHWKRRRGQAEVCESTSGTIVILSKDSKTNCKNVMKEIEFFRKKLGMYTKNKTDYKDKFRERDTDLAQFPEDLRAIVEIFPDSTDSIKYFSRMKQLETRYNIPVQGITKQNASNQSCRSGALDNLAVKLGHSLYQVRRPVIAEDALIFGLDVCHPTGRNPPVEFSILQLVSSTDFHSCDRKKISYHHRCVGRGKEIPTVTAMKPLFLENIKHQLGKRPIPKLVVMLRDGVSDEQVKQVSRLEMKALKDAIAEFDPEAKPRIVFLVLAKRILVRYHPVDQRNVEKRDGTLYAFNQLASNNFFDLYSKNGSNNPLRIILVEDTEEKMQKGGEEFLEILHLLNSLRPCYAFAAPFRENLPTLPAATQYAHKNAKAIFNALNGVKTMEEARKICGPSTLVEAPT